MVLNKIKCALGRHAWQQSESAAGEAQWHCAHCAAYQAGEEPSGRFWAAHSGGSGTISGGAGGVGA